METRISKLLRMDTDLHKWFQAEADRQGRSVNSEMEVGLRYWKETRVAAMQYLPEEKDLNISSKDVISDRIIIRQYEEKLAHFEAEAASSIGSRKGAYQGHITKAKKSLDAMSGNLAYHLGWLKRFKPEVYKQVMEK